MHNGTPRSIAEENYSLFTLLVLAYLQAVYNFDMMKGRLD